MGRRRLDRRLGEQLGQLDARQSLGAQLGDAGHLEGFQRHAGGTLKQQVRQFGIAGQRGAVHIGGDDRTLDRAVVGDTVGDPFKDTAGPSINTQITVVSLVASLMSSLFVAFSLFG